MKKVLSRNLKKKILSGLAGFVFLAAGSSSAFAYNDIHGHWAEPYIRDMEQNYVLGQFEDVNIYPDQYMNRAECAELVSDLAVAYFKYTPMINSSNKRFPDLVDGTRNTDKIRALSRIYFYSAYLNRYDDIDQNNEAAIIERSNNPVYSKIIEGYPNGNFYPYSNVTRAEFAKMLTHTLDCFGRIPLANPRQHNNSDIAGHWGYLPIATLYEFDIMKGYSTGWEEFRPDQPVTRAEAIKMVSQASKIGGHPKMYIEDGGTRTHSSDRLYYFDEIPEKQYNSSKQEEKKYDPYEWEPGLKEELEAHWRSTFYVSPNDTFIYEKYGVEDSHGYYSVYLNDKSRYFLLVDCKSGWFHG